MSQESLTRGSDTLPIRHVLRRLDSLDNAPWILNYLKEDGNEAKVATLVTVGINQLVTGLNSLSPSNPLLQLSVMERTRALKDAVGDKPFPFVADISVNELKRGLKSAIPAMLTGQAHRRGENTYGRDEIKTPSMAAVGTALHIYERSMFERLRNQGIEGMPGEEKVIPWKKDDIIFALEECAMLMHAQAQVAQEGDTDSILLPMIANRAPTYTHCGLGWRSEEDVILTRREFARFEIDRTLLPFSRDHHLEGWEIITKTFFENEGFPTMKSAFIRAMQWCFDVSALPKPTPSVSTRLGVLAAMLFD